MGHTGWVGSALCLGALSPATTTTIPVHKKGPSFPALCDLRRRRRLERYRRRRKTPPGSSRRQTRAPMPYTPYCCGFCQGLLLHLDLGRGDKACLSTAGREGERERERGKGVREYQEDSLGLSPRTVYRMFLVVVSWVSRVQPCWQPFLMPVPEHIKPWEGRVRLSVYRVFFFLFNPPHSPDQRPGMRSVPLYRTSFFAMQTSLAMGGGGLTFLPLPWGGGTGLG